MRLFWSSRSPYARKVMVVAHELGIAAQIETVPTVVTGRSFNADYAALNPTGYLPALALDDGTVLADSTLICDHIEATYGSGRLLPPDPAARLATLRRLSLGNGLMDRAIRWVSETFRPPEHRTAEVIAASRQSIGAILDALEREADAAADRFDLADVTLACALAYLDFRLSAEAWREGRPRLAQRHATHLLRPSLQATPFVAAEGR